MVAMGSRGRAGLVEQEQLGIGDDGPSDTEALLLAAGEPQGRVLEPVLHLIKQGSRSQCPLAGFLEDRLSAFAIDPEGVDHVLEDRHGEGVGLLEDHADAFAQVDDIDAFGVDRAIAQEDIALDGDAVDEIVEAVDRAQERALAATGGADDGGDLALGDAHRDVEERAGLGIVESEILDLDDRLGFEQLAMNRGRGDLAGTDAIQQRNFPGVRTRLRQRGLVELFLDARRVHDLAIGQWRLGGIRAGWEYGLGSGGSYHGQIAMLLRARIRARRMNAARFKAITMLKSSSVVVQTKGRDASASALLNPSS